MSLRIGSLFSGYGGLDMAVAHHYGGDVVWYSEIEPAACQVLAAHHPTLPNLGDITELNWHDVPRVDILTGGYPCQPFSHAGSRKGKDDERHLWPYVRDAISILRPSLVVLENVQGHLTLGFADVLGDLASLGMSARWGVIRAADAGAPHGRARLFVVAYCNGSGRYENVKQPGNECAAAIQGTAINTDRHCANGSAADADSTGSQARVNAGPDSQFIREQSLGLADAAGDAARSHGQHDVETDWPTRNDLVSGFAGGNFSAADPDSGSRIDWRKYAPAIERWQRVLGRIAPGPTILGPSGRPRLNPRFVEWMMGLPAGHVTGHGLSAAKSLKMLGNGVVPQQAALALRMLDAA